MDHRSFSKELAEALIESENRDIDEAELVSRAYQNLCHDDPLPISAGGCYALQKAIINAQSPYALSRRLVDGIDQCVRGHMDAGSKQKKKPTEVESESASSSFVETVESNHEAYALLAWTVHAYIPLKCIKAKSLSDITFMLGSLIDRAGVKEDVNDANDTNDANHHQDATGVAPNQDPDLQRRPEQQQAPTQQLDDEPADADGPALATNGVESNGHHHHDDNGHEMEEVFADESDGSDFEFESGYDAAQHVSALSAWSGAVQAAWDPEQLSRAPATTDWRAVAAVVSELLHNCRYNSFSDLSTTQWRRHRISEQLTQLALALLVHPQHNSNNNKPPIFESNYFTVDHWQRLGVNVLHIFRDAFSSADDDGAILDDYLSLIRILLQLDRASSEGEISTATMAGLGALSSLCGDVLDRRKNVAFLVRLKVSVLDACDDLSALLEKSGSNGTLEWTFLPLFEVLTADLNTTTATTSGETAQLLLNSGLFRQWLLRWSVQNSPACKAALHVSLLDLCFSSPGLLGKYAWRFNGLAAASTTLPNIDNVDNDQDQPVINAFCWNLLGIHLSSNNPSSVVPRKSKKPSSDPVHHVLATPTKEVCTFQALALYLRMCSTAVRIVQDWQVRRANQIVNSTVKRRRTVLEDLVVLSHRLQKYRLLRKLLLEDLVASPAPSSSSPTGATEHLKAALMPLQTLLVQWPSAPRKDRTGLEEKEEPADETQNLYRAMVEEDTIATGLRKAVKTILTAFDSSVDGAGDDDHRYQTSLSSFSSKAD